MTYVQKSPALFSTLLLCCQIRHSKTLATNLVGPQATTSCNRLAAQYSFARLLLSREQGMQHICKHTLQMESTRHLLGSITMHHDAGFFQNPTVQNNTLSNIHQGSTI